MASISTDPNFLNLFQRILKNVISWSIWGKKITLGTHRWTLIASMSCLVPLMDHTGIQMDLQIFEPLSGCVCYFYIIHYIFSSPSNHVGTLFWSLWNSTKAQGILLDLHGPLYGPQNGPSKANFRGPFLKKGPAGSLQGPNDKYFYKVL